MTELLNQNEKVLILYSGGADSRLLLQLALETGKIPYCLLINYQQLHEEELGVAKEQLRKEKIEFQEVTISGLNINSALTGSGIKSMYKGVHSHHVPGRNSMFLSIALSIAEARNIDKVWIGPDFSDRINLFIDCYQEYIVKMRELYKIAGSRPIELEAPLMGMTKELILDLLKNKGIKYEDLFSGYREFT